MYFLFPPIILAEQAVPPVLAPQSLPAARAAVQADSAQAPADIVEKHDLRSLPGHLDQVLVFNSNSPEIIRTSGILLSTFPPEGKRFGAAHLNLPLSGRFDVFAHHIAKPPPGSAAGTLYLAVLLYNPGSKPVVVEVLQAASYLSQPDAPFRPLPPVLDNADGRIYAGPGDRVTGEVLRGWRQKTFPGKIVIPAGQYRLLANLPVPFWFVSPPVNGRSLLARCRSSGPVYAASLALFAGRPPSLAQWVNLLEQGGLAGPRDREPTEPKSTSAVIYGRVAGVARGSLWRSMVSDDPAGGFRLSLPRPGAAYSYVLSTVDMGAWGTAQVQAAPLVVRYPDTAHAAHGNYGVEYDLLLPLYNDSDGARRVTVAISTPFKSNSSRQGLTFRQPPPERVFFRGTVKAGWYGDDGRYRLRYFHIVQRQGELGAPLVTMDIKPGEMRLVNVNFIYPPDATPPQILTVRTLDQ